VFLAGSVACALAPNMAFLVVARGLQGLGAGGLFAIPMTIVGDIVPPRERGRYQAYIAAVYASSSVLGPVIGGTLAEYFHWSLIFWIKLPIAAIAFLIAGPALRKLPVNNRPHKLDVLGAVLLIGATSTLLLALTWSGTRFGWGDRVTLALLAAAAVSGALFARRLSTTAEPLIPVGILRNQVVAFGISASFFSMGTFIGLTMTVPLYFEVVRGYTASEAGLAVIPLMVATTFGAMAAGRLMVRVRHYKRSALLGLSWASALLLVLSFVLPFLPDVALALGLALVSLGIGTVFPVTTIAVQNAVAPHEMGTATSLTTFGRQLGGAFLVAAFGAILVAGGAGQALLREGRAGMAPVADPALQGAFAWIFVSAAVTILAAFLAILIMEERPLRGRD
jgi:MFS family permease